MFFVEDNVDPFFNSTVWEHRDAMHIMKGGAEIPGFAMWLLTPETPELPPTGAITFSGPDSPLILDQKEPVYYEQYDAAEVRIFPYPGPGGSGVLRVVTAVFSR